MKTNDKKEIYIWDLDGLTIEELVAFFKSNITPEMENPFLNVEPNGYDGGLLLYVRYEREETASEKARRIREEERKIAAKQKDEKERKLYERLRKKYET